MKSSESLVRKVVLVTGASSGIGWETALAFARRRTRLGLMARRMDKLRELADKCAALGAGTLILQGDVTRPGDCAQAVEKTIETWGAIDILVNNAGINDYAPFIRQDPDKMEALIRTNVMGVLYMCRAVLPRMIQAKHGHILNIASIAGHTGVPGMAVYCASKFAVAGLTETLRRELYGTGVTLTDFSPGTVETPMTAESLKDRRLAKRVKPKDAADIAERIIRACSKRTPEVIVGEVPGFFIKLTRFFPRLADWIVYQILRRYRPQAFRF